MVKTITPFSTRAKEGATDSPLGDFVSVDQQIVSTADAGFYDSNTGKLTGIKASDKDFGIMQKDESIANGADFITPSANADGTWPLDMTGYNDIFIAIKPTNGGNYAIEAVMGPDDISFANLNPVNPAAGLRANNNNDTLSSFGPAFQDSVEVLTADVWNIFIISTVLKNQKLLQFKITNNSGGSSDVETAFMRLV